MDEATTSTRLSSRVAAELRRWIVGGKVSGDTLPPTGDLMARFGVSRPTIREAFRLLEADNLIAVTRGSRTGARIIAPNGEAAARSAGQVLHSNGATIAHLYEARLAFEPFAAGLLARRQDGRDIAVLRAELTKLNGWSAAHAWGDLAAGLARFHYVLMDLTGNKMLTLTAQTITILLEQHQRRAARPDMADPALHEEDIAFRERGPKSIARLIRLIEAGDADAAEAHWRTHLVNANAYWLAQIDRHAVLDVFG